MCEEIYLAVKSFSLQEVSFMEYIPNKQLSHEKCSKEVGNKLSDMFVFWLVFFVNYALQHGVRSIWGVYRHRFSQISIRPRSYFEYLCLQKRVNKTCKPIFQIR